MQAPWAPGSSGFPINNLHEPLLLKQINRKTKENCCLSHRRAAPARGRKTVAMTIFMKLEQNSTFFGQREAKNV